MSWTTAEALTRLIQAGKENRLAHGYLIVGNPPQIQTELLRPWLKELLGAEPFPHPDVHQINPESKTRQIRVEAIRQLIALLNRTSYSGGWKVGIINEADRFRSEAANAFLKTLEEPNNKTLLLLLTQRPEQVLPTLLSRCLILRLKSSPVPSSTILQPLLNDLSQKPPTDHVAAYHYLNRCMDYLRDTHKVLDKNAQDEVKLAKQNGLEGEAVADIEKIAVSQVETEYLMSRRNLLKELAQIFGISQPELFDETEKALSRSLPESFVFERLFLNLIVK